MSAMPGERTIGHGAPMATHEAAKHEPGRPSLTPLSCVACGRPVALGDGDTARCRACGAEVEIPGPYLALRAATRRNDQARARAEEISAELARPPSLFVRFWTAAGALAVTLTTLLVVVWIGVSLVMCIGMIFGDGVLTGMIALLIGFVIGAPMLYNQALHALAGPLGVDLADVWGGAGSYALLGLAFWLASVVPQVLAAYAEMFESVRTALRTALAADPAAVPGEAEQCRTCGAPLDDRAGALHVRCVYCGSDNLVLLDAARLSRIEGGVKAACTDLESAIAEEANAARRGRIQAIKRITGGLTLVPLAVALGWCVAALNDDDLTFWRRAAASTPMLPNIADNPELPRGTPTVFAVHTTFDDCDDVECSAYYFVALAAGDTLRLAAGDGDLRVTETARRHVGRWYDPTYEWRAADLAAGAPYTGWYRVKLTTTKVRGPEPIVTWDSSPG